MTRWIFSSVVAVMLLLTGCSVDEHDHPDLVSGKQLYEYHCAGCHKADGSGLFLKGVPANRDTDLSAWQIVHKVKEGMEGESRMPIFARMPPQEASKIAVYVKQLGRQ